MRVLYNTDDRFARSRRCGGTRWEWVRRTGSATLRLDTASNNEERPALRRLGVSAGR
jgi:hypothetical protein